MFTFRAVKLRVRRRMFQNETPFSLSYKLSEVGRFQENLVGYDLAGEWLKCVSHSPISDLTKICLLHECAIFFWA